MEYSLSYRCSVRGLMALLDTEAVDNTKEIVPDHLLTILENFLKSCHPDAPTTDSTSINQATSTDTNPNTESVVYSTIQTKRIPFSDIQLVLNETISTRKLNGVGRAKQSLVVCASLVGNAVNLAGLARTCEVFAIEEMTMSNLIVTKSDTFQGIAVNSDQWLHITEVPESSLVSWIRQMKSKKYVIVALEQSDSAVSLADNEVELPSKCVLLLGKEKEG